jgi:hypothetical protein
VAAPSGSGSGCAAQLGGMGAAPLLSAAAGMLLLVEGRCCAVRAPCC